MNSSTKNRLIDKGFKYFGLICTFIGIIILFIFLIDICKDGLQRIDWDFIVSLPSRFPEKAGIIYACRRS